MSTTLTIETEIAELVGASELIPMEGGRTNHVWRFGNTVVKLYLKDADTPLFPNSPNSEWVVLENLVGQNLAPKPIKAIDSKHGPLVLYHLEQGEKGFKKVEHVAAAMGRLHRLLQPQELSVAKLGKAVVEDGLSMLGSNSTLREIMPHPPALPMETCLIHRDPTPSNMIQQGGAIKFIDWQCPAIGDPMEDICHFLSPAMHVLYGFPELTKTQKDAFLAAYPSGETRQRYETCGRAFHWRMACYCQWQIKRGQNDYKAAFDAEMTYLSSQF